MTDKLDLSKPEDLLTARMALNVAIEALLRITETESLGTARLIAEAALEELAPDQLDADLSDIGKSLPPTRRKKDRPKS